MSMKKYHLKKAKTINSLVEIGDQARNSYGGNKTYNKCHSNVICLSVFQDPMQDMEALSVALATMCCGTDIFKYSKI